MGCRCLAVTSKFLQADKRYGCIPALQLLTLIAVGNVHRRRLSTPAGPRFPSQEAFMTLSSLIPIGRNRDVTRREVDHPFLSLQREIDRLFEDFGRGFSAFGSRDFVRDLMP